jgi:hypothetical protein
MDDAMVGGEGAIPFQPVRGLLAMSSPLEGSRDLAPDTPRLSLMAPPSLVGLFTLFHRHYTEGTGSRSAALHLG